MKTVFILFAFIVCAFSQEKGYIDMHGGKKDSLINKSSGFSNMSGLSSNPMMDKKIQEKRQEKKAQKKNYSKK